MKKPLLILSAFVVTIAAAMLYIRHLARAQVSPVPATTITSYDYWDCDPQAAGGASCPPKMKYVETRLLSGERVMETTELQYPAHPKQYLIQGRGKMIYAFPEVNAHSSVTMPGAGVVKGWPTTQNGCVPAGATLVSTGTLVGHKVVTYKQVNPDSMVITSVGLDLNCSPLRAEFHWNTATPGRTLVTYKVAIDAVTGTPPDSIWDPPAGSVETKPSELFQKVWVGRFKSTGMSESDALKKWQSKAAASGQVMALMDAKWQRQRGIN